MNNYKEKMLKSLTKGLLNSSYSTFDDVMLTIIEAMFKAEQTSYLEYEHGEKRVGENKRNGYQTIINRCIGKANLNICQLVSELKIISNINKNFQRA